MTPLDYADVWGQAPEAAEVARRHMQQSATATHNLLAHYGLIGRPEGVPMTQQPIRPAQPKTIAEIAAFLGWQECRASFGYFDYPYEGKAWHDLVVLTPTDLQLTSFREFYVQSNYTTTIFYGDCSIQPSVQMPRHARMQVLVRKVR